MENASKALIMAAGILIGVIIITIGVYVFINFGDTSKEIQKQIDARVLAEFNNNFTKYEGSNEITIHDILSLANFAKENNKNFEDDSDYHIEIYIKNIGYNYKDITTINEDDSYIQWLKDFSVNEEKKEIKTFECDSIGYYPQEDGSQRVTSITFKPI